MCAERMRECKRVSPLIHSAHKLTLLAFALIIPLSGFLIGVAVHCGKATTRSYEKAKAFTFDPRINKGKSNYVFLVLRVTPPCTHT